MGDSIRGIREASPNISLRKLRVRVEEIGHSGSFGKFAQDELDGDTRIANHRFA